MTPVPRCPHPKTWAHLTGNVIVSNFIGGLNLNSELRIQYPGANDDPGSQPLPIGEHVIGPADTVNGVPTLAYNFRADYACSGPCDVTGSNALTNRITDGQKQRAREVLDLYSYYTGVQFVETESDGLVIATGDVRTVSLLISPDPETTPGAAGNVENPDGTQPTAIMNSGGTWTESFGANWFTTAMQQIGVLLGLGESRDLPPGTIMGSDSFLEFERAAEPIFPGDNDILHTQYLFRPDSDDIDMYKFTLSSAGEVTIETSAERRDSTVVNGQAVRSSLDTLLRLYRATDNGGAELISQNDDYFSNDSYIRLNLTAGTYFVGVSSTGNDQYNALTGTGQGGTSSGDYDLRLGFRSGVNSSVVDATGRRLDGDGDGAQGGSRTSGFVQPQLATR